VRLSADAFQADKQFPSLYHYPSRHLARLSQPMTCSISRVPEPSRKSPRPAAFVCPDCRLLEGVVVELRRRVAILQERDF